MSAKIEIQIRHYEHIMEPSIIGKLEGDIKISVDGAPMKLIKCADGVTKLLRESEWETLKSRCGAPFDTEPAYSSTIVSAFISYALTFKMDPTVLKMNSTVLHKMAIQYQCCGLDHFLCGYHLGLAHSKPPAVTIHDIANAAVSQIGQTVGKRAKK